MPFVDYLDFSAPPQKFRGTQPLQTLHRVMSSMVLGRSRAALKFEALPPTHV